MLQLSRRQLIRIISGCMPRALRFCGKHWFCQMYEDGVPYPVSPLWAPVVPQSAVPGVQAMYDMPAPQQAHTGVTQ